jgi:hypothetical protein
MEEGLAFVQPFSVSWTARWFRIPVVFAVRIGGRLVVG